MRVGIALDKEQAKKLLRSTSHNLRMLATDYFRAEEYSKEHEENGMIANSSIPFTSKK